MKKSFILLLNLIFLGIVFTACSEPDKPIVLPEIPTGINVVKDLDRIYIGWRSINNAEGYNVYRSLSDDGIYEKIISVNNSVYRDSEIEPNTTYYYKVSAYNRSGESSLSEFKFITSNFIFAPINISASSASSNTITIIWEKKNENDQVKIFRSSGSSSTYELIGTTSGNSYTDIELDSSTKYYYKLSAFNNDYESIQSEAVSMTTLEGIPAIPTNIKHKTDLKDINISWRSVNGAILYKIYKSEDLFGLYEEIDSTSLVNYKDSNVERSKNYFYAITACNNYGESEKSEILNAIISINIGKTWDEAISFNDIVYGEFPENYDEVWYNVSAVGTRTLYGKDRYESIFIRENSYTGDIVVDIYRYTNGAEGYGLYEVVLNYKTLIDIDLGNGAYGLNNITASNWDNSYYIRVRPKFNLSSNKGTFELVLAR